VDLRFAICDHRSGRGFTLIELMISIALILLLMLGINQVFKVTGEAVGASQALSAGVRDARSAQSILSEDFNGAVGDLSPCMLLLSRTQPAFRNRNDELADKDYNPAASQTQQYQQILSQDLDRNGVEGEALIPGEVIHPTVYNYRNHRTDIFSMFSRGLFRRQTGGDVPSGGTWPFIADMTTTESWIWFGHLRLPDNTGAFSTNTDPGQGSFASNANNYHASNWILGRQQILLKDKDADNPSGRIKDRYGRDQLFIDRNWTEPPGGRTNLSPLAYQSRQNMPGIGTYEIQESRYDLAAMTMAMFRQRLTDVITDNQGPYPDNYDWFQRLFLSTGRRFQCNPFSIKPLSPASYSQQYPVFLRHCSQFIVEYAGDYVKQDNDPGSATYGQVLTAYFDPNTGLIDPNGTDGVVDYVVINPGTVNQYQEIRWYGLPRDTNGDGRIPGDQPTSNLMPDVVPLRDIIRTSSQTDYSMVSGAPFEKFDWQPSPPAAARVLLLRQNYAAPGNPGMTSEQEYLCAWGPTDPKPKMIRMIVTIDDPTGRMADGQTFEYVFRVGG
jgi:prepilin-type N-terminal cleavage/methylation domain-containing protein